MGLALFLAHFKKQFSSDAVCEVHVVEYRLEQCCFSLTISWPLSS